MTSFLVVGEALVDVVTDAQGQTVERPGGSPANVAVGLGRLGNQVTLLTALGDDARGQDVRAHLETSRVTVVPRHLERTAVAHAQLDDAGVATYEFDIEWDLPAEVPVADWLHVGSIGATLEPGGNRVLELARAFDGIVSYDPNCRPLLMADPLSRIEDLVRASDVVKLSDEDCDWLFPDLSYEAVARRWLGLGPRVVVLTRGAHGAQAWTRDAEVHVGAVDGAPVVDTVGAGDSFMAALIAGLDLTRLGPDDLRSALVRAATVARRTCERAGADPPWSGEL